MSKLIMNIIESGTPEEEIPLPNISTKILQKIITWLEYHADPDHPLWVVEHPLRSAKLTECGVGEFDADFYDKEDNDTIGELICGANYLDITPLTDLGAAKV